MLRLEIMNNWQKLCELLTPLIKEGVAENLFHDFFESVLKTIFNWDSDSIHHKMQVPMGSDNKEADIVLTGSNYGIVIEMKKPLAVLGDKEVRQLTSYMRILGHKFGFLIANEFRVFYDNDTSSNVPIQVSSFGFDPNNSDGISLCNILDKNICSNEKLKEYAIMHIKHIQTQQEMDQLKTELLNNNGEKIKGIIKNKLISDGYDENYINDILNNIVISYKAINNQPPISGTMNGTDEKYNINYGGEIEFRPNRNTFRENLLRVHRADYTIIYSNGREDKFTWNANNISETSDIINNIRSGPLRGWKDKGIIKAIFEVKI
jgi:hypothetical protein